MNIAARYDAEMTETRDFLARTDGERVAVRAIAGAGPTVVWLGGFKSEMAATKAQALADWAASADRSYIRFDYFGHGDSSGRFQDGTVTRWREDALAVIDERTEGDLVLVGSSMGGWIACLTALARPERVRALVLIAPAADFTETLMAPEIPPEGRAALAADGVWLRPSPYGDAYPITQALLDDGARWSILGRGPIDIRTPVRILQGAVDPDVPWRHALALADALASDDVIFTLIKDGDHRLSRLQDIARLIAAAEEVSG